MPWRETCAMEQRMRFVCDCLRAERAFAELWRYYGVSRKTGYKWLGRYRTDGLLGLQDRGQAPRHHPQAVAEEVAAAVLAVRRRHPSWGPRKVRAWLVARHPAMRWPAASTIGARFDRVGLTVPRRRRLRVPPQTAPLAHARAPNTVWTVDFKGWFRTARAARAAIP